MVRLGKEWLLWAAAALLLIGTCLMAAAGAPDMAPVTVIYPAETVYASETDGPSPSQTAQESQPFSSGGIPDTENPPTGAVSSPAALGNSSTEPSVFQGKININTADKETLMLLDGVGEVIAGRIIEYRESHGGFDTIEELMEVKGIGEKRFAVWKSFITV